MFCLFYFHVDEAVDVTHQNNVTIGSAAGGVLLILLIVVLILVIGKRTAGKKITLIVCHSLILYGVM